MEVGDWLGTSVWADSLETPLYQFLTSFTSLLNYICIVEPNSDVLMVGADFNSPGYFFEEEMRRLNLGWEDWTTPSQKEHAKHSSLIDLTGKGTLLDGMPFIQKQLRHHSVRLISFDANNLLVTNGFASLVSKHDIQAIQ